MINYRTDIIYITNRSYSGWKWIQGRDDSGPLYYYRHGNKIRFNIIDEWRAKAEFTVDSSQQREGLESSKGPS